LRNVFLYGVMVSVLLGASMAQAADKEVLLPADSSQVELHAFQDGNVLRFVVINKGSRAALLTDDFCFDSHLNAVVIDPHAGGKILGGFSSGLLRKSGRMARVAAGKSYECEITYFPDQENTEETSGFTVWSTALFIGRDDDTFSSRSLHGLIRGDSSLIGEAKTGEVDELAYQAFKNRTALGIYEP